jgi:glycosyltransferase involved in cell wall biosynthesis
MRNGLYMGGGKPLISIGIPVYNGSDFLPHALESLLSQDYENFELIISDNNSTDSTQKICLDYMVRDKRIRYFRNEKNVGPQNNFNKVFELSEGEYFMWHAHDDLREPNYISSCLEIMEMNPNVILCCSSTVFSEDGNVRKAEEDFGTVGMSLNRRFRKMLWNNTCSSIYGLIRSSALRKTGIFKNTVSPDNLLLAELSLLGEFCQLPLFLFNRRIRRKNNFQRINGIIEIDLSNRDRYIYLPFIKLAIEHWKLIQNSRLDKKEKIIAFLDIILCFLLKYKIFLSDSVVTLYLNLSKLKK